ncbi:MAG: tetratricopeptide repeat protein [Bacteroidetes bacterium]|nr:tetratricopeptide repeat protein [Bacteroidota bacterium]
MKRLTLLIAICLLGLEAQQVFAQSDPLEPGRQAFREGRYEDAAEVFGQVAQEYPQLAEAHFLLSRVYFETPLYDEGRARRTLEKALELEPENLEYLVARLEQYRVKSWGLLGDRLRESRRLETARKILKVDPSNAHAHEELGRVYIRDFWRYRNAIMMPSLSYGYAGSGRESDAPDYEDQGAGSFDEYLDGTVASDLNNYPVVNPNEVFLGDQFNIEALRSQGVNVLDLSRRAERAYQRAIAHLEKALEVDPRRRSVYDEMMQIYVLKGEYEDAMNTLDLMYRFYPEDPDLWRYLGVANYQMGNMDAANRSFETAFGFMDRNERRAYEDLGLFLTRDEKKLEAVDSVAYRARYWASQDPRFLTSYNERKLEHYFRLTYADLLYSSKGLGLRGWETERGQILIRYGPPISDIVLHPQEDGIFSARQAVVGAMVNSVTSATDDTTGITPMTVDGSQSFGNVYSTARQAFEEMNAYNIWEYGDFRFVFEDPFRNGEYRMYSPSAEEMATRVNSFENDYIRITKEIIRKTPQKYEYEAPGRQIELPFLVSSFKGDGQQTELFVNYGIPLESTYDRSTEMIEVNASAGTFLINDRREVLVERTRNIYGLPTNQVMSFAEQHLWIDTQQMQVPSGTHELSVEFETASGQTVAVQRREIMVPNYDQTGVILSDIMLAYSVEQTENGAPLSAAEIVRRDLSILPAPWSVYSTEWPIYLYFEIYGLALNAQGSTDYDIEITLEPKNTDRGIRRIVGGIFGRNKEGVSVSYKGSGSRSEESLYQILDASDQETGLYTLTLVVRDNETGEESERTQDLFLEE